MILLDGDPTSNFSIERKSILDHINLLNAPHFTLESPGTCEPNKMSGTMQRAIKPDD